MSVSTAVRSPGQVSQSPAFIFSAGGPSPTGRKLKLILFVIFIVLGFYAVLQVLAAKWLNATQPSSTLPQWEGDR